MADGAFTKLVKKVGDAYEGWFGRRLDKKPVGARKDLQVVLGHEHFLFTDFERLYREHGWQLVKVTKITKNGQPVGEARTFEKRPDRTVLIGDRQARGRPRC